MHLGRPVPALRPGQGGPFSHTLSGIVMEGWIVLALDVALFWIAATGWDRL